jgi:hypothetical protein
LYTSVLANCVVTCCAALLITGNPGVYANLLPQNELASAKLIFAVVQAVLILRHTLLVARNCAGISDGEAVLRREDGLAIIVLVDTLILAQLIETVYTLILACVLSAHTICSGEYKTTRIVLVLAVVQAVRVLNCAFLVALTRAAVSPQEALLLS